MTPSNSTAFTAEQRHEETSSTAGAHQESELLAEDEGDDDGCSLGDRK